MKEFCKSFKIVTAISLVAYFLEHDPRWEFTTFSVLQCFDWRQEGQLGCKVCSNYSQRSPLTAIPGPTRSSCRKKTSFVLCCTETGEFAHQPLLGGRKLEGLRFHVV